MKPLSKSQFTRGIQCLKSLWLYREAKELQDPVTPEQKAIFDAGTEVGVLARRWIGGGVLVEADHQHPAKALAETQDAIKGGANVLYEAAFLHDDVLVRADIIKRNTDGTWDLFEVKSTTKVEETHFDDVAVQRYVLTGAGLKLGRVHVVHLDAGYVRYGALDLTKLFHAEDVTTQTEGLLDLIPGQLAKMKAVAAQAQAPERGIGAHCTKPHDCSFLGHCWAHIPEYSVFNLGYAKMDKKLELWNSGVHEIRQINPAMHKLTAGQRAQVEAARSGKAMVNVQAIRDFLATLRYPLAHLDFETSNPPVPPYDGLRPYMQMPFQAVLCVQDEPGAPVVEHGFLGDGLSDPRRDLINFLLDVVPKAGSILAYHKSFEAGRLDELAGMIGSSAHILTDMVERLADLADPFRTNAYTHPDFRGRWSIKAVLPVLVPSMTYKGLEIGDGAAAMAAYAKLRDPKLPAAERARLIHALKVYCGQDVVAMVKILEHLYDVAAGKVPAGAAS